MRSMVSRTLAVMFTSTAMSRKPMRLEATTGPGSQRVNPSLQAAPLPKTLAVPVTCSSVGVPCQKTSLVPQVICEQIYVHPQSESFRGWEQGSIKKLYVYILVSKVTSMTYLYRHDLNPWEKSVQKWAL